MDGGSVAGTLFIVFLILKLMNNINWSWWWVTSPIWIDLGASLLLIALVATGVFGGIGVIKRRNRRAW